MKKIRRYATPPLDFQRKWAEINLQLNFLGRNVRVGSDDCEEFLTTNWSFFGWSVSTEDS